MNNFLAHPENENLDLFQVQMEDVREQGDDELYDRLDTAYCTEDEETEVDIIELFDVYSRV